VPLLVLCASPLQNPFSWGVVSAQTKGNFLFNENGIKWVAAVGDSSVQIKPDDMSGLNWVALNKGHQLEVVGVGKVTRFRNFNSEAGEAIKKVATALGKTVEKVPPHHNPTSRECTLVRIKIVF